MKVEKVLEKLEELFRRWGLDMNDWVLFAQYASKLQGYRVNIRRGHFNVHLNKDKLWWKTSGREAFPPKDSKEFNQFKRWMKETGYDSDLIPKRSEKLNKMPREDFAIYSLPNRKKIRIATATGRLKEMNIILAKCKEKKLGREKAIYILNLMKELKRACLEKKDLKAVKLANKLISKYKYLEKEEKILLGDLSKLKIIKGKRVYKGKVKGKIKIILNESKARQLKEGEILVVKMISARFIPIINRAKAIITDHGGLLSHAAIVAREFKIPCMVGTKIATQVLKDGDLVEVDANKGIIRKLS